MLCNVSGAFDSVAGGKARVRSEKVSSLAESPWQARHFVTVAVFPPNSDDIELSNPSFLRPASKLSNRNLTKKVFLKKNIF